MSLNDLGVESYEIKEWIDAFGSVPIERIAHMDVSQSYEMDRAHVFSLKSGKYALVVESGCSCYEPSQASIELFPSERAALEAFHKWGKSKIA